MEDQLYPTLRASDLVQVAFWKGYLAKFHLQELSKNQIKKGLQYFELIGQPAYSDTGHAFKLTL